MDFQAILDGIKAEGQQEIERIQADAKKQAGEINQTAKQNAEKQRKRILADGRTRLNRETALIQQQAAVQSLKIHADSRQHLIEATLENTKKAFPAIRKRKDYPAILSRMVNEVIQSVTPSLLEGQRIIIHFDKRDKTVAEKIIKENKYHIDTKFDLESAGGCTGETDDELVTTLDTIESRFSRANDVLQQNLSVFFEEKISSD
jgi:vacuolar-type H+-ATPase subunit E/Vma4